MYIAEKINRTRKVLKALLSSEWDVSVINDLSLKDIEIMYENANRLVLGFNCRLRKNSQNMMTDDCN